MTVIGSSCFFTFARSPYFSFICRSTSRATASSIADFAGSEAGASFEKDDAGAGVAAFIGAAVEDSRAASCPRWISSFFFQAADGIRGKLVTGVQTCALPICCRGRRGSAQHRPVSLCARPKRNVRAGPLPQGGRHAQRGAQVIRRAPPVGDWVQ